MKAPLFWYRPAGPISVLLSPLGLLWRAGSMARRALAEPYRGEKPIICIGNIVAGGAGKTPVALAIAHLLRQMGERPVFVTRGYGGREAGPRRVEPERQRAREVGDEALLLARAAPTWIGRDRPAAIKEAERHGTHVILDDGLQNPRVRPDLGLLVIDGETGFGNGRLIPAGPLREPLEEALRRVAAVILIGAKDPHDVAVHVTVPLLRAQINPQLAADFPREEKFLAFAGIGRPEKFYATCRAAGLTLAGTKDFGDHHVFNDADLTALRRKAEGLGVRLLTTEKDYVRLPLDFRAYVTVLPVRLAFADPDAAKALLNLPK